MGSAQGMFFSPILVVANNKTITDSGDSTVSSIASYYLLETGQAQLVTNTVGGSNGGGTTNVANEWLQQGASANFTCSATNSGAALTAASSALSTTLQLSSPQHWGISTTFAALKTATVTITITSKVTGATVATPVITLSVSGAGAGAGGSCVVWDSWLTPLMQAHQSSTDMWFDTRSADDIFARRKPIKVGHLVLKPCVSLETDGGASLRCSLETPFDLREGDYNTRGTLYDLAPDMLNRYVLVNRDGTLNWERVVKVKAIGEHLVIPIDFGGYSYPAGDDAHAMIYNHNKTIP